MPTLQNYIGLGPSLYNVLNGNNFALTPAANTPPSGWTKNNSSITTGQLGPDGANGASKLVEDGTTNFHDISGPGGFGYNGGQQGTDFFNVPFRLAVIAKAAERTRIVIELTDGVSGTASAGFDLSGGNTGYDNSVTTFTILNTVMTQPFTAGWWLCIMDATPLKPTCNNILTNIYLDNGTGTAARSTHYLGDGASGALIWYASLLPKGAWAQLTTQQFFDDFTSSSTIDLNDTRAPGFNWYPHAHWPSTNQTGSCFFLDPTLPAADIVVSNSILTLLTDVGTCGKGLMTAAVDPNDSTRFIGQVFNSPCVIESLCSYDPTVVVNHANTYIGTFPTFWTVGLPNLVGANVGVEIDILEVTSVAGSTNSVFTGDSVLNPHVANELIHVVMGPIPANQNEYHRYADMVLNPTSDTNNLGIHMGFIDGMYWQGTMIQWNEINNVGGLINDIPRAIILGAGFGNATGFSNYSSVLTVDWVRVIGGPQSSLNSIAIHDKNAAVRQTGTLDQSNTGIGPWAGGRFHFDGSAGVLIGKISQITFNSLEIDASAVTQSNLDAKSSTTTQTSVASSASSVILLNLNIQRLGATIFNDSTQNLFLLLGTTQIPQVPLAASTTTFTVKIAPGARYKVPFGYVNGITGIWTSANGFARITEHTL